MLTSTDDPGLRGRYHTHGANLSSERPSRLSLGLMNPLWPLCPQWAQQIKCRRWLRLSLLALSRLPMVGAIHNRRWPAISQADLRPCPHQPSGSARWTSVQETAKRREKRGRLRTSDRGRHCSEHFLRRRKARNRRENRMNMSDLLSNLGGAVEFRKGIKRELFCQRSKTPPKRQAESVP